MVKSIVSIVLCFSLSGCGLSRYYEAEKECNQGYQSSCDEANEYNVRMKSIADGFSRMTESINRMDDQRRLNDAYINYLNNANTYSASPSYSSNCTTLILGDGMGGGLAQTSC